jgi:hypothetical protein
MTKEELTAIRERAAKELWAEDIVDLDEVLGLLAHIDTLEAKLSDATNTLILLDSLMLNNAAFTYERIVDLMRTRARACLERLGGA